MQSGVTSLDGLMGTIQPFCSFIARRRGWPIGQDSFGIFDFPAYRPLIGSGTRWINRRARALSVILKFDRRLRHSSKLCKYAHREFVNRHDEIVSARLQDAGHDTPTHRLPARSRRCFDRTLRGKSGRWPGALSAEGMRTILSRTWSCASRL